MAPEETQSSENREFVLPLTQPAINPLSPSAHQLHGRLLPVDNGSETYDHGQGSAEEESTEPVVEAEEPEATEEPAETAEA